jgi:hypothetical protein
MKATTEERKDVSEDAQLSPEEIEVVLDLRAEYSVV